MGIVSGLVLFAVIWSMTFLVALPIRVQTQGDLKDVIPGTHAGAPEHHHLKKKAMWTTLVALIIWGIVATIILSEWISVDDVESLFRAGAWSGRDIDG
jgi:predicted secreted protein